MDGDGNGWVECAQGHAHWGLHGAAGLLLHAVDDTGVVRVLMQHRASWSHHGGTWGVPGGARDSHEDGVAAALREAAEEAGLDRSLLRVRHIFVDDHGGWSYTTVYADAPAPLATEVNRESVVLEWVPLADVPRRRLHPGFAATWPQVRAQPVVLLVDTANVVGARPDGWWRDRAAAAGRMLTTLSALRAATVMGPRGGVSVIARVVAVLEGAATSAAEPGWVEALRTPRRGSVSGDDVLVKAAAAMVGGDNAIIVVTADRGLRARVEALAGHGADAGLQVVGPRWLLGPRRGGRPALVRDRSRGTIPARGSIVTWPGPQ